VPGPAEQRDQGRRETEIEQREQAANGDGQDVNAKGRRPQAVQHDRRADDGQDDQGATGADVEDDVAEERRPIAHRG